MRYPTIAIIAAAALLFAAPAPHAQEMTDQQFVSLAAMSGLAEVQLGRLAAERARRPGVVQFAERMVLDHGALNAELAKIAQRITMPIPIALDDEHQQTKDRLARLSAHDFDRAYMQEMVSDHLKDIAHFEHQSQMGLDRDLKAFAASALPVLREHLELARAVNTQVVLGRVEPVQPAASPLGIPTVGDPWCSGGYSPRAGTNFGGCTVDKK